MTSDEEILKELKKISKIMTLANGNALETEIAKYATTTDRKKIWILVDGNRHADEIVKVSGVSQAPVYKFLKILEDANLIERPRGQPPRKWLDYAPAEWIDLIQEDSQQSDREQKTDSEKSETQSGEQDG